MKCHSAWTKNQQESKYKDFWVSPVNNEDVIVWNMNNKLTNNFHSPIQSLVKSCIFSLITTFSYFLNNFANYISKYVIKVHPTRSTVASLPSCWSSCACSLQGRAMVYPTFPETTSTCSRRPPSTRRNKYTGKKNGLSAKINRKIG